MVAVDHAAPSARLSIVLLAPSANRSSALVTAARDALGADAAVTVVSLRPSPGTTRSGRLHLHHVEGERLAQVPSASAAQESASASASAGRSGRSALRSPEPSTSSRPAWRRAVGASVRGLRSNAVGSRVERAVRGSPSRRFQWATWRSGDVRRLLAEADVIVAVDADAVAAAWLASRRNQRAVVTVGLHAAGKLVAREVAR